LCDFLIFGWYFYFLALIISLYFKTNNVGFLIVCFALQ
jgi:hypothetical protein